MKIKFFKSHLQFISPFKIFGHTRDITPAVYIELEHDGITGYGEAVFPPYRSEKPETTIDHLQKLDLSSFSSPLNITSILHYVDEITGKNTFTKAAIDIALHDLTTKLQGKALREIWSLETHDPVLSTFTIGIGTPGEMEQKIRSQPDFQMYKLKLGTENDREIVDAYLSVSDKPFCVDANQGWEDKHEAIEMTHWLKERGCVFIEQPMHVNALDKIAYLTEHASLPVIADESVQTSGDIDKIRGAFSGINIKLMKCGGLYEAKKMITKARKEKMFVMVGCMSESSCAVTAAANLSFLTDWADVDGPLLINNDPFDGITFKKGQIIFPDSQNGIGATPNQYYNNLQMRSV